MRDGRVPHVMRQPLLARFGGQLIIWGCRLQARYARLVEPTPVALVGDDGPGQTLVCSP